MIYVLYDRTQPGRPDYQAGFGYSRFAILDRPERVLRLQPDLVLRFDSWAEAQNAPKLLKKVLPDA